MRDLLTVFVAGGVGSSCRYLVGLWAARTFGTTFPIGTLTVNVLGSFAMAIVVGFAARGLPEAWRLAIAVGFLGGFTTYSSFNQEVLHALGEGGGRRAAAYVLATLLLCLLAAFVGDRLFRALTA